MDWTKAIDAYCERTGASYWAEPVNALTNAAFLIAALVMWRRLRGQDLPLALALCLILAMTGVGSYLFHTHATAWAGAADVLPIGAFILVYVFATNLHVWRLPIWAALLGTVAFVPYAWLLVPVFRAVPFLGISAGYWPVPLLIAANALALARRAPATARGLGLGAAILVLSLVFRSLDGIVCPRFALGTHFLWHILNALMLGWMVEVYRHHRLAERQAGR